MECKSLRESGVELKKFKVAYFGASCDPAERNQQFSQKLDLDYPLLSDSDRKVATEYGILRGSNARRVTIVVDQDGKIAHIETKVNVREAGKQLVELLQKLEIPAKG